MKAGCLRTGDACGVITECREFTQEYSAGSIVGGANVLKSKVEFHEGDDSLDPVFLVVSFMPLPVQGATCSEKTIIDHPLV